MAIDTAPAPAPAQTTEPAAPQGGTSPSAVAPPPVIDPQERSRIEAQIRAEIVQENRSKERDRLVTLAEKGDASAKARLADLAVEEHRETTAAREENSRYQALTQRAVGEVLEILGLKAADVPAEARRSLDALRVHILDQSPAVQARIKDALERQARDAGTVEGAQNAAAFAGKLGATPNAHVGSGTGGATATRTIGQVEFDQNRGNSEWRRANRAGIEAGRAAGNITR